MIDHINYTQVTLVLDRDFGDLGKPFAQMGPLWMIGSPINKQTIKKIWAIGDLPFTDAPTYFDDERWASLEEAAVYQIGAVDLHHPDWMIFEIIGVAMSDRLVEALCSCAPGSVEATPTGFIFRRTLSG